MNALAMACAFATVWIAMSNPFADRLDLVTGASESSINAFLSKGKPGLICAELTALSALLATLLS